MFVREKDLIEAFSFNTRKFLDAVLDKSVKRHFVIEEFDSYFGVADLVLGTYRPHLSKKSCREPINLNWIHPLITFKVDDIIDIEVFADQFALTKKATTLRLAEYADAGFIFKLDSSTYIVTREYEFITDNVVAIEAKLKNWKRALFQAKRYTKFSDFTFVLLDESYAAPALSNLDSFLTNNIGLVTMNKNGFNVHARPKIRNSKKDNYLMRINEAAYSYFAASSTPA